jgi:hypothetical protein
MPTSDPLVFTHDPALYRSRVYAEGAVGVVVALVAAERLVSGAVGGALWFVPLVVGAYAGLRLLVTGSVPRRIELHPDRVVFVEPRRTREFRFDDIVDCRVREFRASATLYLRLKPRSGREQKYWVEWKAYSDGDDLLAGIRAVDLRLNPDSLKVIAGLPGYVDAKEGATGV